MVYKENKKSIEGVKIHFPWKTFTGKLLKISIKLQ